MNKYLFNNTVKTMKTLNLVDDNGIFNHLKKHELLMHINRIITLISIRINCRENILILNL